jgi:hypothetical protein
VGLSGTGPYSKIETTKTNKKWKVEKTFDHGACTPEGGIGGGLVDK